MTTTVVSTIGAGQTYSTLQSWEDAAPGNLVTADQIWQGQQVDSFSGTGQVLGILGSTTDATRYKQLIPKAGSGFIDNPAMQSGPLRFNTANGVGITGTSFYTTTFLCFEDYFRMDGIQVNATAVTSGQSFINTGVGVQVTRSIFEHEGSEGWNFAGNSGLIQNALIVGRHAAMSSVAKFSNSTGLSIYGVTIVVPSDLAAASAAVNGNYSTRTWVSCAFFNCTAVKNDTSTDSFFFCASDVVGPPSGITGGMSYASSFQNVIDGSHDYRLKSGSPLLDIGATTLGYTDDIVGTPRGSFADIGCWEFIFPASAPLFAQACL